MSSKVQRNLEHSYQHILNYRHKNGSFSSFGPSTDPQMPRNGSTWLTAYVVRSLHEANNIIAIDKQILENGLNFLASKQTENGSFIESGDFFYHDQNEHLTLTASVLLTFLETKELSEKYQTNIERGLKYLLENLENSENIYAKAVATFALNQAKHATVPEHIAKLKAVSKSDDDRMWWSQKATESDSKHWWRIPYRGEVETTSYILLTLLDSDSDNEQSLLPILKWLVAQRNSFGGFWSSQDTVVGLRALIKFAQKYEYSSADMEVEYEAKGKLEKEDTIKVTADNALVYQNVGLPEGTESLKFEAKGKGSALMQISYQYNILEKEPKPSFVIDTDIKKDTPARKLEMNVCVSYNGEGQASNMAILEVSLPSGFVTEDDFRQIKLLQRVRVRLQTS